MPRKFMQFRQERPNIGDSIRTIIELPPTREALCEHLKSLDMPRLRSVSFGPSDISVKMFSDFPDPRIGKSWPGTCIVWIMGVQGVIGYTDSLPA